MRRIPTATVQDANGRDRHNQRDGSTKESLLGFARHVPTPCTQEAKNSTLPVSQRDRDNLPGFMLSEGQASGGQLNPLWVEWLQGFPIGWTDCAASATDRFHKWCASHGKPSAQEPNP